MEVLCDDLILILSPTKPPHLGGFFITNYMTSEQPIHFHEPAERKDGGLINYTSVPAAIDNWRQDPHGRKAMRFLIDAYGINPNSGILEAAGMGEYLQYKQEGRFIGFVAAQILKPTYYYLSNAIILGELARRGLPTALMVFEYPQDPFLSRNPDKRNAFGNIDFFLNPQQSVKIKVNPIGIKGQPVGIRTINGADGHPCKDVLINVGAPTGPGGIPLSNQAALGLSLPEQMSLTDFYKFLWTESINRLRRQGILPDESLLPMFFVDVTRLYSTLAAAAQPSPELLDQLLFSRDKRTKLFSLSGLASDFDDDDLPGTKLRFAPNGLLVQDNGMMDAASYYPMHTAWPDLYLECSSCGGEYFVTKLARAQQLKYTYGLPETEVRLPDTEVPDLERYCLHPTGYVADLSQTWKQHHQSLAALAEQIQLAKTSAAEKKLLFQRINELKQQRDLQHQAILADPARLNRFMLEAPFAIPASVAEVYNQLLQGVPERV